MAVFRLDMRQFARDLERRVKEIPREVKRGVIAGAKEGRMVLKSENPKDTGKMREDWSVSSKEGKRIRVKLFNDTPYAGIVEVGARPHAMNAAGIESVKNWAIRKLGATPQEAERIAYSVSRKIQRQGQKPTYFVRENLEKIVEKTANEVGYKLTQLANRRAR